MASGGDWGKQAGFGPTEGASTIIVGGSRMCELSGMSHGPIVVLSGPQDPRALENIPVQPRRGNLDVPCPTCQGRGQYNVELHPHGRSKREPCHDCGGEGWIETTGDLTPVSDIVLVDGQAQWITRYVAVDNSHLHPAARPVGSTQS